MDQDRQPGPPVQMSHTDTEMTWQLPLPGTNLVLVLRGRAGYLGCAIRRVPVSSQVSS